MMMMMMCICRFSVAVYVMLLLLLGSCAWWQCSGECETSTPLLTPTSILLPIAWTKRRLRLKTPRCDVVLLQHCLLPSHSFLFNNTTQHNQFEQEKVPGLAV